MKKSLIHIENIQIKSLRKAKYLASLLDDIEVEFGIKEVWISVKNNFVCPDIDLTELTSSEVPMERLLGKILIKCDRKKYGKESKYKKIKK